MKKPKREVYEPSRAAQKIADRAMIFKVSGYVWEEIARAADDEYGSLVQTAKEVVEYVEGLPDAEARIFVRLLRNDLENVTPPKNVVEQSEEQFEALPDPGARELEAAVGYLAVCMNQDFARMVLVSMKTWPLSSPVMTASLLSGSRKCFAA